MVFNDTFNNISAISWWSVLLVEETINLPQVTVQLYHKMLYQVYLTMSGFELITPDKHHNGSFSNDRIFQTYPIISFLTCYNILFLCWGS
jgi:hypothetical protein